MVRWRLAIAVCAVTTAPGCMRCAGPPPPIPPPARCGYGNVADSLLGSVTVNDGGGVHTLEVVITLKGDSHYTFAAALDVDGGQLFGIHARPRSVTASVNVSPEAKPPVSIRLPASCEETPGSGAAPLKATVVATINEPSAPHPEVTFAQEP